MLLPGDIISILGSTLFSLITIAALYFCYRINRTGDNKEFIARYTCLYVPLYIKTLAMYYIFYFFYSLVEPINEGETVLF